MATGAQENAPPGAVAAVSDGVDQDPEETSDWLAALETCSSVTAWPERAICWSASPGG